MRSIFTSIFVLLTTFSLKGFSQDNTAFKEAQVKSLLCRNWKAVSMEANGRKAIVTKASILSFKNDGTFTDSTEGFGKSQGSWIYHHLTKSLETIDKGGKSIAKLIELTGDKFILEMEYPEFVSRITYLKIN
jgi:hypothetical protein